MGLAARVKQLEEDGPELCEQRYCTRLVTTEVTLYPDGTADRIGEEPPPKCASCPYREGGGPIRHVEVVRRYRTF
jgi:hypothetical protein